jgi:hypothetical protein
MLKVCENRVLRKILGPEVKEVTEDGGECIMGSPRIRTSHQVMLG